MFEWSIDGEKVSNGEFLYRTSKFLPKPEWLSLYEAIKSTELPPLWYIPDDNGLPRPLNHTMEDDKLRETFSLKENVPPGARAFYDAKNRKYQFY